MYFFYFFRYTSPTHPDYIDYYQFCDDVESALTIKGKIQ